MTTRPFYPATHPSPHAVGGGGYPAQQQQQQVSPQFSSFHQHQQQQQHHQQNESPTPSSQHQQQQQQPRASGSGLIRLTLRKPMGIVFEPLPPTPGQTQKGSGVRICDLPRTGAAFMSGRLEVGDELLSINDVTMSRLTFDQIMDFIINADPEGLRILFRRPKKEDIHGTLGVAPSQSMTDNNENSNTMNQRTSAVQWGQNEVVHEEVAKPVKQSRKKKGKSPRSSSVTNENHASSRRDRERDRHTAARRVPSLEDEDDDDMTEVEDDENTYMSEEPSVMEQRKNSRKNDKKTNTKAAASNSRAAKSGRNSQSSSTRPAAKQKIKAEESFLDLLINNICQVTAGKGLKKDDFSDDGISYAETNTVGDEDTYADGDESTYGDDPSIYSTDEIAKKSKSSHKNVKGNKSSNKKNKHDYEDDYTLETTDSADRLKANEEEEEDEEEEEEDSRFQEDDYEDNVPLGLAPQRKSKKKNKKQPPHLQMPSVLQGKNPNRMVLQEPIHNHNPSPMSQSYDQDPKLPFRELEYEADGGDVSVLTNNMSQYGSHISPQALVYAHSYAPEPGKTLEESIETNPERFYKHVVSEILGQNEPEKVRLLDKLLAKYQGREEHLIQKLTVRYRSGKHVAPEASPLSQHPPQEQPSPDFQDPNGAMGAPGPAGVDPNNQDVDPWNTRPNNSGGGLGMGINDDFAMPPPSQGNFFQPSLQVETAPPPPPMAQPGAPVSAYQTLGSVGTTDEHSPLSAAFPEEATPNIYVDNGQGQARGAPVLFSPTGQPVPPPPPGRTSFEHAQQHAQQDPFVPQGDPNAGFFHDQQQQQQAQEEEVYYDDEPDEEEEQEQGHFEQEVQSPQQEQTAEQTYQEEVYHSSPKEQQQQQQQFQSQVSPAFVTTTSKSSSPSQHTSFSPQGSNGNGGGGVATSPQEAYEQNDFGHEQVEYGQEEDVYEQQQQQDPRSSPPLEIHPSRSRSPHPGVSPQSQGQQVDINGGYVQEEEEYSEVDNETEGEDSAYTSEYSDSQGMDGTSPAVIAQVSELLNFVYGKTSVTGQIDRVSTIMRAYEGRENVLLELLETKALIKANQSEEPTPQGLIASSASHDHSGGSYGDEDGMEEHPDDISSVSGDDSRFNVKVPLAASGESSAMVSPMTHPSVDMESSHFARDRTQQHQQQHMQNNHQYNQQYNNNNHQNQQNYQQGSRPKQPPQKTGQENRGGRQANQNNSGGAKARATAAAAAASQQQQQQQEKKKKGSLFGGLFKGKKNKSGKKDAASNNSLLKNNNGRDAGLSGFTEHEQEV